MISPDGLWILGLGHKLFNEFNRFFEVFLSLLALSSSKAANTQVFPSKQKKRSVLSVGLLLESLQPLEHEHGLGKAVERAIEDSHVQESLFEEGMGHVHFYVAHLSREHIVVYFGHNALHLRTTADHRLKRCTEHLSVKKLYLEEELVCQRAGIAVEGRDDCSHLLNDRVRLARSCDLPESNHVDEVARVVIKSMNTLLPESFFCDL